MHGAAAVLLVASTAAYLGFQATIRLLVYPQFAAVAAADFPAYEQAHRYRVTVVVGPLFAAEAVGVTLALVTHLDAAALLTAACYAAVLGVTAAFAVPCHERLSRGFDPTVHRRLLRVDLVRLLLAAAAVAGAVWFASSAC